MSARLKPQVLDCDPAPVAALRELYIHLREGVPLSDGAANLIATSIEEWLNAGLYSLDKAFGLKRHGGVSPGREVSLEWRNQAIIGVWAAVPEWSGLSAYAAARMMSCSADRYRSTRWGRERLWVTPPSVQPAATWWLILSYGLHIPSAKRIEQILKTEIQEAV